MVSTQVCTDYIAFWFCLSSGQLNALPKRDTFRLHLLDLEHGAETGGSAWLSCNKIGEQLFLLASSLISVEMMSQKGQLIFSSSPPQVPHQSSRLTYLNPSATSF